MFVLMRRDIRLLLDDGVGSIRSRGRLPVAVDKVIGRRRTTFRDFSRTGPWSRDPDRRGSTRESKQEEKARGGGAPAPAGPRLTAQSETRAEGEAGRPAGGRPPSLRSGPSLKGPDLRALTS